jgi:hypothetical protein
MKKLLYPLIILLVVAGGIALANFPTEYENTENAISTPLTTTETKEALNKWQATPEGINFRNWQNSAEGKKILTAASAIAKHVKDSSNIQATVTSLTLPPGSRLGYGIMVNINNNSYILSFGALKPDEFQQLRSLKVNDAITIKSKFISYAPKYAYPIVSGDYVGLNNKIIFKKPYNKNGC